MSRLTVPENPNKAPGHTCPTIDRLIQAVRKHVPKEHHAEIIEELEALRAAHVRLRELAAKTK